MSVDRLIATYREGDKPNKPILRSASDVAAYAAYRMPATYLAMRKALSYTAQSNREFRPSAQLDLGAGTGAAVWAASAVWPSLTRGTAIEQSSDAVALGSRLAESSDSLFVRNIQWQRELINGRPTEAADLVTVSYVLGELSAAQSADLVDALARFKGTVVFVEPGTPAGYQRILDARNRLIDKGLEIIAPCPHRDACPIPQGRDWCHFSVRVNRSSVHRAIKNAALGHEDEKFSYVAASTALGSPPRARILRHPQQRKGLVSFYLCTEEGLQPSVVSKRQGSLYRAARDAEWGDGWPPSPGVDG